MLDVDNDKDEKDYQLFCQDCLIAVGEVLVHAHDDAVGDDRQDDHVPAGHSHQSPCAPCELFGDIDQHFPGH